MEYKFNTVDRDHWLACSGIKVLRRHWGIIPPVWGKNAGSNGNAAVTGALLPASDWGMFLRFNLTELTWEIAGSQAISGECGKAFSVPELYQACIPLLEKLEDDWIAQLPDRKKDSILIGIANRSKY